MSRPRFIHTDLDGDTLDVRAGNLGAVVEVQSEDIDRFETVGAVAVRYEHLPKLIATLQEILDESDHGGTDV